jgi:hypothetical protein
LQVAKARKELEEKAEPAYQAAKAKVDALQKEVKEKEARKAQLYDKQGAFFALLTGGWWLVVGCWPLPP